MNGVVTPVIGMSLVTPPTITKTCMTIANESPPPSSLPKVSRTASALRMPRMASRRYTMSVAASPTKPSSSPMAALMKSVCASGTVSGRPEPSPVPNMPPVASPNSACAIWYPPPASS